MNHMKPMINIMLAKPHIAICGDFDNFYFVNIFSMLPSYCQLGKRVSTSCPAFVLLVFIVVSFYIFGYEVFLMQDRGKK
jgi:hypothetical protein